ncbi:procathepsin L-like [Gigantopelta aegis]|uniref:procathepsin L-like n=1 Tax=Gigantopelta aegis TaxID=1735272 RepID=UPI001B88B4E5|nr:procathepsin L-like [Gigantopelta aegis]
MKIACQFFVSCLLFGACIAAPGYSSLDDEWHEWKVVYNKVYATPGEELHRRRIWEENLDFIEAHNNRAASTYTLGMNEFGDQRVSEKTRMNVRVSSQDNTLALENNTLALEDNTLTFSSSSFDWRKKGVITAVKNQGMIGSSEALVVTESVQSYHAIKTSELPDVSVQEVVDCCSIPGHSEVRPIVDDCFGCVHNIGGLCSSIAYKGGRCNNGSCTATAQVEGTKTVTPGKEDEMARVLREQVPLMVYVDASHGSFQFYKSGVYHDSTCSKHQMDHSLQIVGYGVIDDILYWICKNSWGENWGQKGYIWMRRGTNECGIATRVKYPF